MTDIDWDGLRAAAIAVRKRAYAPYSEFPVGAAALVDDGRMVLACNVENASYGLTLCAECGVVSQLHATGGGRLVALSCVDSQGDPLMPCGRCRQLLWEHGGPDCLVDAWPVPLSMAELLPQAFGAEYLPAREPVAKSPAIPVKLREFHGRGTVFVHPDVAGGERVWTGYWERSTGAGDEPAGILEEAGTWPAAGPVVAWGRSRTPRVVVVAEDGATYWAGEAEPPTEVPLRWEEEA
ncbi:MAG TPA: cytidine deaminase [Rugosimonospora sp.]|nr:cytidine deaminase [Rugosimonospora sp.]